MEKIIKISFWILFYFSFQLVNGQYFLSNTDISLKIKIEYRNDTTLIAKWQIINKSDNPIYFSMIPLGYNEMYTLNSKKDLLIENIVSIDYVVFVDKIDVNDTLYYETRIISNYLKKKNMLLIEFDYLNINKFEKVIQNDIYFISKNYKNDTLLFCPSYREYRDILKLKVPFCFNFYSDTIN